MMRFLYLAGLAVIYLFLIAPLLIIILVSFGSSAVFEFPPPSFTLHWYKEFFNSSPMTSALFSVSLPVALLTAGCSLIIGVPMGIVLSRMRFAGRNAMNGLVSVPLIVPQILLGVALLLLSMLAGVRASIGTLVLAHVVITLPYVVNTVAASLHGIQPSLEEAAMNLGTSRVGAFMRVTLPLIKGALLSSAIFAFIISLSDINLSLFLNGPGAVTIPVYIFSSIMFQADPTIAAAAAVQILLVAVLLVMVGRTAGLGGRM
ncbi:ABC transporter permease [Parapusillimonas sp. SGNA-6]|nr:ABC transporter permease [Parapusillimonas sp. SGNA-6]